MRRILVDRARKKGSLKRGGGARQIDLEHISLAIDDPSCELLVLDDALGELERNDPQAAQLVMLRFFTGLTHQQAADGLGETPPDGPVSRPKDRPRRSRDRENGIILTKRGACVCWGALLR